MRTRKVTNITPGATQFGRSHLSDDQVAALRQEYEDRRRRAVTNGPEGWEDVSNTDAHLANAYGITTKSVAELVTGRTRRRAGGPIDVDRRAESDQYRADRAEGGNAYAKQMARYRLACHHDTRQAPPVTVGVQVPGKDPYVKVYPAGTIVSLVPGVDTKGWAR